MLVNMAHFAMRVIVRRSILVFDDDIDLGSGQASAAYLAHFDASAYVQRCSRFLKESEGYTRIDKCAEQHVAADAGEALQISDSHGNEIVPTRRAA